MNTVLSIPPKFLALFSNGESTRPAVRWKSNGWPLPSHNGGSLSRDHRVNALTVWPSLVMGRLWRGQGNLVG